VAQCHGSEQREDQRRRRQPGERQRGEEQVLSGLQQRGHQPVQASVMRMARAQSRQQHGLHRCEHQDAGQVAHPERGKRGGHEHADDRGRHRGQAALDEVAEPQADGAVIAVRGDLIPGCPGGSGPGRHPAIGCHVEADRSVIRGGRFRRAAPGGREPRRAALGSRVAHADDPAGEDVAGGDHAPCEQREEGHPRAPDGAGHDKQDDAFPGGQGQ
jgi:hypothetical protein